MRIDFEHPEFSFLLLTVIGLFFLQWGFFNYRDAMCRRFAETASLLQILHKPSRQWYWWRLLLLCATWCLLILVLMSPRGSLQSRLGEEKVANKDVVKEDKGSQSMLKRLRAHDVIFLLDASASMSVKDTRTGVSRFQFAKEMIQTMSERLRGENVALYAFTSEVTPVVPLTMDTLYLRMMLPFVSINEGDVAGTDLIEAFEFVGKKHFRDSDSRLTTVILLTDGGDTYIQRMSGEKREQSLQALLTKLGDPEKERLRVFTIGLGGPQGSIIPGVAFEGKPVESSLDEDLLKAISQKGRGRYYFANEYSALAIANDIQAMAFSDGIFEEEKEERVQNVVVERFLKSEVEYDMYYQIPLGFALLFLCLEGFSTRRYWSRR